MPPSTAGPIGIFGGSFDPVHYGHLRTAYELLGALSLSEVRFIPSGQPPHRARPVAGAALRTEMLRAAIEGEPRFVVDERELTRDGPSYTVDTLSSLRAEYRERPLCLLLGMDAFLGLPRWHQWRRILSLAHVVAVRRPGWSEPQDTVLLELIGERQTAAAEELSRAPCGRIHFEEVTLLDISSSELRRQSRAGIEPKFLVPERVRELIAETRCYASDAQETANG